jgi:hypothetical protein
LTIASSICKAHAPWLIYGGNDCYSLSGVEVIGWRDVPRMLREAG